MNGKGTDVTIRKQDADKIAGVDVFIIAVVLAALAVSPGAIQEATRSDPPLEALLSPKHYREYQRRPEYKKRLDVYRESLSDHASSLRSHVNRQDLNEGLVVLGKIRALAHYALEEPSRSSASPKDFRSKEVKKLEIRIRRLIDTLNDAKNSIPYRYRNSFEQAEQDLEDLRNLLLEELFGVPFTG